MRVRRCHRLLLGAGALVWSSLGTASAQPIEVELVDTLAGCGEGAVDPGVTIGNTGLTSTPLDVGYRFTVEPAGVWLAKELTICASSAGPGPHFQDFSLREDEGGVPGSLAYAFDLEIPFAPSLVSAVASVRPAELVSGVSYWIVAERDFQRGIWWLPLPLAGSSDRAQREGDGPWESSVQLLPQLRLRALPEPAATALAALLAIAALGVRRRRARRAMGAAAAAAALLVPAAARAAVEVDFTSFGSYTAEAFGACRVQAMSDGDALVSLGSGGLGVQGSLGTDAGALDGGESLFFLFPALENQGATGISYRVAAAGNENGSGSAGEAFLEAFGEQNQSLGVRAVSGVGPIDVSALFGGAPIQFFRLVAAGDAQTIDRIAFTPAPTSGTFLHLDGFGFVITPLFEVCEAAISGSSDVVLTALGLGIAGGSSPSLLDGFEWVRFDFERPQTSVFYTSADATDANGSGLAGEAFVEGYGAGGASLGLVAVSGEGTRDVTALFGGALLSGFRVVANVDAQRLSGVIHVPEAGAAGGPLASLALLLVRVWRRAAHG